MNSLPTAVIFDVDGTLCDVRSIKYHLAKEPRDFESFFPDTLTCPPHHSVLDLIPSVRETGHVHIVVTARSDAYREVTAQWLGLHGVDHDDLYMRPGDPLHLNPDDEVKEAILAIITTKYRVVHAIEDNPSVVALWERHGIPVTVVPGFDGELGNGPVAVFNPFI